ncbi:MAG: periplasmic heavy metal sensor [Deltaproteobacteria bacterium]|nr:periplasmic heavy metal sensor [Deltaproteobacteria bacterium]
MRIVWIAVAALLVGTAGPPCAEGFVGPKGKWWHLPRVSESLNLTDQEKAQLDEKYLASRRRLIELKSALERERLELETLMEKEPLDEAAVMQRYGLLAEDSRRGTIPPPQVTLSAVQEGPGGTKSRTAQCPEGKPARQGAGGGIVDPCPKIDRGNGPQKDRSPQVRATGC